MLNTLKYIFIALSSLLLLPVSIYAQTTTDTATTAAVVKPKEVGGRQLCLGIDASQPIINAFVTYRQGYEFAADYYMHGEIYGVAEGGWGNANVDYPDLKYKTSNSFYRIGFNKCLLPRMFPTDWDMMFIGLRLAMAPIQRSNATYTIIDSLWGNSSGKVPNQTFIGYWAEITGGMRVELIKHLMVGWNIRGRFLMNEKAFAILAPIYVAGYGRGDKNAVFDFNFYINYAIRWKRKT